MYRCPSKEDWVWRVLDAYKFGNLQLPSDLLDESRVKTVDYQDRRLVTETYPSLNTNRMALVEVC